VRALGFLPSPRTSASALERRVQRRVPRRRITRERLIGCGPGPRTRVAFLHSRRRVVSTFWFLRPDSVWVIAGSSKRAVRVAACRIHLNLRTLQ
jgi:hypothetical protein